MFANEYLIHLLLGRKTCRRKLNLRMGGGKSKLILKLDTPVVCKRCVYPCDELLMSVVKQISECILCSNMQFEICNLSTLHALDSVYMYNAISVIGTVAPRFCIFSTISLFRTCDPQKPHCKML